MRSELGRYTIAPYKYSRAIKYWLRIIHLPDNILPKLCYKLQTRWTETNTDCWAFQVRGLLFRTGFGDVWLNQGVERIEIFLDIDMQTQNSDIQDMDRLRTYKLLKTNFGCENYLFLVKNKMFRTALVRFRGSLPKLECNEGRYRNVPLNERVCPLCHTDIETEYHFLLICPQSAFYVNLYRAVISPSG